MRRHAPSMGSVGRDAPIHGQGGDAPSTGGAGERRPTHKWGWGERDAPSTGKEPRKSRVADRATVLSRVWKTHRWGNKGTVGNQVSAHLVKQDRDL